MLVGLGPYFSGANKIAIIGKNPISETQLLSYFTGRFPDTSVYFIGYDAKGKKPTKDEMVKQMETISALLTKLEINIVMCLDSAFFSFLAEIKKKPTEYLGYVITNSSGLNVCLGIHPYLCTLNPDKLNDFQYCIDAVISHFNGTYTHPHKKVKIVGQYLYSVDEIIKCLENLKVHKKLGCDIEAFSLKHIYAGIGTIAFAWSKNEGISFPVMLHFYNVNDIKKILLALKNFFIEYEGTLVYHNMNYDAKVLLYTLFMDTPWDYENMLIGLNVFSRSFEDTKIISYLATNSAGGNDLSLKYQAKEYVGKYSEDDIKDITKIPLDRLLEYNLKDACATLYVEEKNTPIMIADEQLDIYTNLFKPAIIQILNMELIGLPVNPITVKELAKTLRTELNNIVSYFSESLDVIAWYNKIRIPYLIEKENKDRVNKLNRGQVTLKYSDQPKFNPSSGDQVRSFLYDYLGLQTENKTQSGKPSTDTETLEELFANSDDVRIKKILKNLIRYNQVSKIVSAFIPSFESAILFPDNISRVFGSFNLGGTVSGRLSSSDPNLQTIPNHSVLGALIKQCIQAPEGWLYVGLDFEALEDHISALTTKDPQKLKVYLEGYDGHCLRAYYYFKEQIPDITIYDDGEAYKVTMDNGDVLYLHESDPRCKELGIL